LKTYKGGFVEDYAKTYAEMMDDELLKLAAEQETLADSARGALFAELAKRGIGEDGIREWQHDYADGAKDMKEKQFNSSSEKTTNDAMKTVAIHTVQGSIEAEIVQACLRSSGIESTTQGLAAQRVHPFTVDGMGNIKILVMERDAEAARQTIADFLEGNSESNSDQDL
jgi:hypothetical protein